MQVDQKATDVQQRVVKTGFNEGLGACPEFSFLNLAQRSAATIARMKQLKTCIDVWYAKHTAQLEDMEDILRDLLIGLEQRVTICSRAGSSMKKQNSLVYKWYMDYQLTQVDNYLSFLNQGLKSLPENQPVVLHQYSLDPKKKPVQMDFSNHFQADVQAAGELISERDRYESLLIELKGELQDYYVLLSRTGQPDIVKLVH